MYVVCYILVYIPCCPQSKPNGKDIRLKGGQVTQTQFASVDEVKSIPQVHIKKSKAHTKYQRKE